MNLRNAIIPKFDCQDIPLPARLIGLDGSILDTNALFVNLLSNLTDYSFTPEIFSGKKCFKVIGNDVPCPDCIISTATTGPVDFFLSRPCEKEKTHTISGYGTLKVFIQPILDKTNHITAVLEIVTDVIEHGSSISKTVEQLQKEKTESLALLNTLIDNIPMEIWAMDHTLRYTIQNATSINNYGNQIGKRIDQLGLPPETETLWIEQDMKVLNGETLREEYESQVGNEHRFYENLVAPIIVDKKANGIVGIAMDITKRKQAEIALKEAHAELEQRVNERTNELQQVNEQLLKEIAERKQAQKALQLANEELEIKVEIRTQELKVVNKELQRLALLDGLTGVANRRYLDDFLEQSWRHAKRAHKPLALLMIDIDFFKLYNDTYGHLAGDSCLKSIANAIKTSAKRGFDFVARYGGEEFVVILPDTNEENASFIAEKIRVSVESLGIKHKKSPISNNVTVTIGVTSIVPKPGYTPSMLITIADKALYLAKNAGRNQIKSSTDDEYSIRPTFF